ncbi:MAG: TolC family protein [Planctomycetaceae bacterium]|nr:TolC family protein [Planctomycetaceae bacterium]
MDFGRKRPDRLRRWTRSAVIAACLGAQLSGCRGPKTLTYLGDADLQYYKQSATEIDYPHVHTETDPIAAFSERPPTVREPTKAEVWALPLQDALQLAINNNRVIKSRGAFKSPANPLMANPERVVSTYDPAIQETNAGPFQKGPEAALSQFDTQFKTSMNWGRDETIQNNFFLGGGLGGGQTLVNENAQFKSSLQKIMATGGAFEVSHNWNYMGTNQQFQLFPSVYRGFVRADYRQPLLAGAGVDYTRTNGPILRTIPGLITSDGVVIARINTDIALADFELNVTSMIRDVEDLYWELYLAYRTYDAQLAARDAALNFWRNTKRRMDVGARKGAVVDEVQARENYYNIRAGVESALGTLYAQEGQLRRMLGLSVNDGRIIRPSDEPLQAEYIADWRMALSESLVRRIELRRQKWQIKSLELQLSAAENLIKPRLDFVSGYQVNGFGNDLLQYNADDGVTDQNLNSAYSTLTRGDQTSWDLGLEFSLPIGLRHALAHKRNSELRLTKARAVLAAQEQEISHELSNSFQLIDWWYQLALTNFNRKNAAEKELEVIIDEYNAGRAPVDLLLRSRAELAAAETGYYSSLVKYNQALTDMRVRKGTLLEDNNIHLAEGGWEPAAYDEALRRAWARSFAYPAKRLDTQPPEFEDFGPPGYGVPLGYDEVDDAVSNPPPAPAAIVPYEEPPGLAPVPDAAPPVIEPQ